MADLGGAAAPPTTGSRGGSLIARRPGVDGGVVGSLLRMSLFLKLIIANGVIVLLAVLVCASLVVAAVKADPNANMWQVILPVVIVAFLIGTAANAGLVHLALTPLRKLAVAAERVSAGEEAARAEESAFADLAARRTVSTFNRMLDNVTEYRRRLREIAIRAIDAGEAERRRISSELHDGIAQSLASVLIQLRIARASIPEEQPALTTAAEQLATTIGELRAIAHALRPPALDMIGLSAAILSHTRDVAETTGLRIDVNVDGIDGVLTNEAELALYRLMQEAVLNVVRHAETDHARITVTRDAGAVVAIVSDDGVGFDVNRALAIGSLGLFGMYERASYVGGRVTVTSRAEAGTSVRIEMPSMETQNV